MCVGRKPCVGRREFETNEEITIDITNPKIEGLQPVWASFPGFSGIFENPGEQVERVPVHLGDKEGHVFRLHNRGESPPVRLYQLLRQALKELSLSAYPNAHELFPLPLTSYHVTAWDGVNVRNVHKVEDADVRARLGLVLDRLPDSLLVAESLASTLDTLAVMSQTDWNLRFQFGRVAVRGMALVAALVAAESQSAKAGIDAFARQRRADCERLGETFGIEVDPSWVPHVTLGYFPNQRAAELASAEINVWNPVFSTIAARCELLLNTVKLTGFTDMVSFYRR